MAFAVALETLAVELLFPNILVQLGAGDAAIGGVGTGVVVDGMRDDSEKFVANGTVLKDADLGGFAFAAVGLHLGQHAAIFGLGIVGLLDFRGRRYARQKVLAKSIDFHLVNRERVYQLTEDAIASTPQSEKHACERLGIALALLRMGQDILDYIQRLLSLLGLVRFQRIV